MNSPASSTTLLLVLPLPIILLGIAVAFYLRKRKPQWLGPFFLTYFGFLSGVLLCVLLSSLALTSTASRLTEVISAGAVEIVGIMEILKVVVAVIGGLCVAIGAFSLLALWFSPRLLELSFVRKLTVGRLQPSRRNHALIAFWSILSGAYLVLFATGHQLMGFVVLVLWLPFGIAVLKIGLREQTKQV